MGRAWPPGWGGVTNTPIQIRDTRGLSVPIWCASKHLCFVYISIYSMIQHNKIDYSRGRGKNTDDDDDDDADDE